MSETARLGFQCERVINHLESEVIERPDYQILRTASSPDYYFGNLLALKVPLHSQSKAEWQACFAQAFAHEPLVQHQTYSGRRGPDEDTAAVEAFVDENFDYEEMYILAATRDGFVPPAGLNREVQLRELATTQDWQQWLDLARLDYQHNPNPESVERYLATRVSNYRQLNAGGFGRYLGAFIDARLIGYAGLYHHDRLARFQSVLVLPEFENRKIAKTLLSELVRQAPKDIKRFVIVADEHYHATRLYQSLGFEIVERECSLCWWPDKMPFFQFPTPPG
jgi:ribosomal protein S18 acetylase RimI-like enzyme